MNWLFHNDFVSLTSLGYLWSNVSSATVYLWLQYHKESVADLNVKHFSGQNFRLKGVAQWKSCWHSHKVQRFDSTQSLYWLSFISNLHILAEHSNV